MLRSPRYGRCRYRRLQLFPKAPTNTIDHYLVSGGEGIWTRL